MTERMKSEEIGDCLIETSEIPERDVQDLDLAKSEEEILFFDSDIDSAEKVLAKELAESDLDNFGSLEEDDAGKLPVLPGEVSDTAETEFCERSLIDDITNPDLFKENIPGEYTFTVLENGKIASGVLELCDNPERDAAAQKAAGGSFRKEDDDGGHLIGARFGGESIEENLEAQNRQLNRGEFKAFENDLAKSIREGDKVFVNYEAIRPEGSERPSIYMGYAIKEHPDGSRDSESFFFPNMSEQEQKDLLAENDSQL